MTDHSPNSPFWKRAAVTLLTGCLFIITPLQLASAQNIDTLSYFHPDSLEECAYISDVLDLAVHFQVPAGWERFGIIELGLMAHADFETPLENWLYVCTAGDGIGPGEIIDSILVTCQNSTELFPHWKVIDLSGIGSLQGRTGDFWVRGPALFTSLCGSSVPSGHTYAYSLSFAQWQLSTDLPLRAVVQDQTDSLSWLDFFPMHIGDQWQYHEVVYTGGALANEEYVTARIAGDSIAANGKRYFVFDPALPIMETLLRIDTLQQRIYSYHPDVSVCYPDSERLVFDFTLIDSSAGACPECYDLCASCERDFQTFPELADSFKTINCQPPEAEFGLAAPIGLTYNGYDSPGGDAHGYSIVAAEINGIQYGGPISIKPRAPVPEAFRLKPAYPNPFNPVTTVRFDLPAAAYIDLTVYDILGREITRLVSGYQEPGYHEAIWDGRDASGHSLPSGIYIARLTTPQFGNSIKMLLLR
ncbi:MAG: T9SS type A sorting domain-containing protein [Fidelibacterota bacterium]|nr:MAG: T9SS type A sorting domain-containing protein [Candidatus Neomarinimicrobiota bacterium]